MRRGCVHLLALTLLAACTQTYPYLVTTDGCNCQEYVFRDRKNNLEIAFSAYYEVGERVITTVEMTFHNRSRDTLSLRQAFIKGTSRNIRYQYNDRFQPMPYVVVLPGGSQTISLVGSDTEIADNPWFRIAGERVSIEIKGMTLGGKVLDPVIIHLIPVNPEFSS